MIFRRRANSYLDARFLTILTDSAKGELVKVLQGFDRHLYMLGFGLTLSIRFVVYFLENSRWGFENFGNSALASEGEQP